MMSHTVMSICTARSSDGMSNVSSFLLTFAPSVVTYRSSNSSSTNRRTRDVFPTAASPTRHTFAFIRSEGGTRAIQRRPSIRIALRSEILAILAYKGVPRNCAILGHFKENIRDKYELRIGELIANVA